MGIWGTSLFSSDTALDAKDTYLLWLSKGVPDDVALKRVLDIAPRPHDDDECEFWLALASTQWKYGRLDDCVKQKALALIESGGDVNKWKLMGKFKDVQKRKKVIEDVKAQLLMEMPARKKVKEEYYPISPWESGDVILYNINDKQSNSELQNKWVALHIVSVSTSINKNYDTRVDYVSFMLFSWIGTNPNIVVNTLNETSYVPLFDSASIKDKLNSATLDWSSNVELERFKKRIVPIGNLPVPDYVCKGGYYDKRFKLNNFERSIVVLLSRSVLEKDRHV